MVRRTVPVVAAMLTPDIPTTVTIITPTRL
jgi:hypothetical protein